MKKEESYFCLNADVFPEYKVIFLTAHKYLSVRNVSISERCW